MIVFSLVRYQNVPIIWSSVVSVRLNHTSPDGFKDTAPLVRISLLTPSTHLESMDPAPSHPPFSVEEAILNSEKGDEQGAERNLVTLPGKPSIV